MVAIIDTNSHEIHSRPNWSYKGLYPLGAILSHSCIINSRHILEKDSPYYNTCLATSFIPKGKGPSLITLARFCLFVCFKGGMGRGLPRFPPLSDERVCICRDPQSREFPLHHYSGLGTGSIRQTSGTWSWKIRPHYTQ